MELNIQTDSLPEEFVEKIKLSDGTEFLATAGSNQENTELWIWFDEPVSFKVLADAFSEVDKLSTITVYISKYNIQVYSDFTSLGLIQKRNDGKMSVRLDKAS